MEPSHHMVPIRELDLSLYRANSIADKINGAVQGLKTSTGKKEPLPYYYNLSLFFPFCQHL